MIANIVSSFAWPSYPQMWVLLDSEVRPEYGTKERFLLTQNVRAQALTTERLGEINLQIDMSVVVKSELIIVL